MELTANQLYARWNRAKGAERLWEIKARVYWRDYVAAALDQLLKELDEL